MQNHHPHDRHHHARHDQLQSVSKKIRELVDMKSPTAALYDILHDLAVRHGIELPTGASVLDLAAIIDLTIANNRAVSMSTLLATADNRIVLGAGEIPPHLIGEFLQNHLRFTQVHETHGHMPPHAMYFLRKFVQYEFATSVDTLVEIQFGMVVVHSFELDGKLLVTRLASVASKLWGTLPLVNIRANHQAPHHLFCLDRQPDFSIME